MCDLARKLLMQIANNQIIADCNSVTSLSAKGGGDKNPEIPVSGSLTGIFVFNVWTNKPLRSTLSGGNSAPFPGLPPDEGSYSLIVCILHASILRVVT